MSILRMIAEWRWGCSHAGLDHPESCHECTVALIDAIAKQAVIDDEQKEQNGYEFQEHMARNDL